MYIVHDINELPIIKLEDLHLLFSKSDRLQFAILSTTFAFTLGIIAYTIPMAAEHIYFFISAPIATFFPSYLIWKLIFKKEKDYKIGNIIVIAIILTVLTHYLNFVILGLGRLICYYLIGNCTDHTGEVESLIGTLTYYSFLRTGISLYYWGVLSLGLYITIGLYVMKRTRITKE